MKTNLTLFAVAAILLSALRLAPSSPAQNAERRDEATQPLNYDSIATRLVSYRGREVIVQGKLAAITQTRNGPVLTVVTRGRTYAYLSCSETPKDLKVNEQVVLLARVPVPLSAQYLEYIKVYGDDDDKPKPTRISEEDLAKVKFDETGEQKMLELINEEREKAGLKPYKLNEKLQLAARKHSADMALKNYSSHNSLDGTTASKRVADEGVSYGGVGENIATSSTVANAHKGLMESPGHKSNLMSRDFTDVGIGIVKGTDGSVTVTQNFIYKH